MLYYRDGWTIMHFYRIKGSVNTRSALWWVSHPGLRVLKSILVLSPDFNSIIPGAGGKCGAVGGASQRGDSIFVRKNTANFDTLHCVPQMNQIVVITAKYQPARQLKIVLKNKGSFPLFDPKSEISIKEGSPKFPCLRRRIIPKYWFLFNLRTIRKRWFLNKVIHLPYLSV